MVESVAINKVQIVSKKINSLTRGKESTLFIVT